MLIMVLAVLMALVLMGRPPISTLLFAVALAVGLSPELLPAILTINLARSAQMMARSGVLVRHLNAIENLGGIDVLCTDKTGTLTEGVMTLEGAYDPAGRPSPTVLAEAALNAALETGIGSPLDDAILAAATIDLSSVHKRAEIPFDFVRKRVSVVAEDKAGIRLVAKGAFHQMRAACTTLGDGTALDDSTATLLDGHHRRWSAQGYRVLAVATRRLSDAMSYGRELESDLAFQGFLTFVDPPKPGVRAALADMASLGVSIKMITGDTLLVAQHVAALVGLDASRALTGEQLQQLSEPALQHVTDRTDLFAEVDPNQKERIIRALRRAGHTVGFLGDGVNDAPAMHAADTSLSVDDAVDVARDAADFVLLERDLNVIRRGIEEGRRTFANTMKYIRTTTSANLGNMLSMAVASTFLPFLPLLPGQILLNNFLSDVPAIGLADDNLDAEQVARPTRWNVRSVTVFMLVFGLISSGFDFLTFGLLLQWYGTQPETFRTAWFIESLLTELVVALVVRTYRPFFRSRPGTLLLWSTVLLIPLTFALPVLPFAGVLGFVPIPMGLQVMLVAITALYACTVELAKRPLLTSVTGMGAPNFPGTREGFPVDREHTSS
jgi:Mg2+-importing ATPase